MSERSHGPWDILTGRTKLLIGCPYCGCWHHSWDVFNRCLSGWVRSTG